MKTASGILGRRVLAGLLKGVTQFSVLGCIVIAATLLAPQSVSAQEITGAIRGSISTPAGSPAAGVSVRVVDNRTGTGRTTTTDSSGTFTAAGLVVGGPYSISIESDQFANQRVTDVFLDLGSTYTLAVTLQADSIEEIVVTASAVQTVQTALGPSATFSLRDLQDAPAINRDINDVIRIDPRIYVDEAGNRGDQIQCGGANPRFNSLTVDGVRLNDQFGLNSNGYPTTRIPFSYDAIEQVSVELAPFDVKYGGFTACNINAVSKAGSNEFHGSVFYDYTDDSLSGDSLEGDSINLGSFDETRFGFSVGGPIVSDKLFFFAAYEKLDGAEIFPRGPVDGSGAGTIVEGVTQAQLDEIADIARTVYGYDPGPVVSTLPVEDEKYQFKLDWNINDNHRAALVYNYNDGFAISESDGDNNEFEFSNHYYERGAELKSTVVQLFSTWTDNFSTEVRINKADLDNRQISLGGTDFGEVQVRTFADADGDGNFSRATVYLGADDSRQANKLSYESLSYKLSGKYSMGVHTLSAGWERDELEVFNLFVQEAEGEYEFESGAFCGPTNPSGCIDQFRQGRPDDVTYENAAPSNNADDAAAMFAYEINTLYFQDELSFDEYGVTVVMGVRYDWYTSDDAPTNNPNFLARNGFANTSTFDGEGLIQPRFGITWEVNDDLSLRGGAGLYSGGNPNVWLSNNYSNNGITQVEVRERSLDDAGSVDTLFTIPHNGGGRPIFDIPQALFDGVASGSANSGVNAVAPDFEIPSNVKIAIGATYHFDAGMLGDNYTATADLQLSRSRNAAIIVDSTLEQIGLAADGRPIYRNIDRSDPDCRGNGGFTPLDPNCGQRRFQSDYILDNVKGGTDQQTTFSLSLGKSYDWGLDWRLGYTYTEADDVSPMTSAVAFSNYAQIAVSDPNDPGSAQSNYEIPNRYTLQLNFRRAFFGDNMTKFSVFGSANQGRPFSATFSDGGGVFGDFIDDRHLLYIPTGASDPNVIFDPGFDQTAFFNYINESDLARFAGGPAARNSMHSDWWTKFDIKVEQELPGFGDDHRFSAFFIVENFGNLLNDDWGVLREASFPRYQPVVNFGVDATTGQYIYQDFIQPDGQARATDASLWELRFGVRYEF